MLLACYILLWLQIDLTTKHPTLTYPPHQQSSATSAPLIPRQNLNTTPALGPESQVTPHELMEREIGGQGEAIGDLKAEVTQLRKQRDDPDRKDIDSLKSTRDHLYWAIGVLTTVFTVLAFACKVLGRMIWEDSFKPRITKFVQKARQPLTPDSTSDNGSGI